MLSFSELQEKLIIIGNGANYGQVLFMAGGVASGKGFVSTHFIEGNKFKAIDPDHLKTLFLQQKTLLKKYPELKNTDLRNPDDATRLHDFIKGKGWEETLVSNLLSTKKNPSTLPNLMIDAAFKNLRRYDEYMPILSKAGYVRKNTHLIWVLTDYTIAVKNNRQRSRVAPDDIQLESHEGAANTLYKIVNGEVPEGIDGGIYVVLNNPNNTVFWNVNGTVYDGRKPSNLDNGGKIPKIAVEDFKYIQIKKPGQPPIGDKKMMEMVYKWIYDSIPSSEATASVFNDIRAKTSA